MIVSGRFVMDGGFSKVMVEVGMQSGTKLDLPLLGNPIAW
jgi:hypothetical protein